MKKLTIALIMFTIASQFAMAGGMMHNTNASAQWIRMLCRDASLEIDAVFYNPAGLTKLDDGFHIAYNHQMVWQARDVKSENPTFNNSEFIGKTFVPVLPSIYLAWKKNNLVIHGGFAVVGGGGSATFEKGVPSFESSISVLPDLMTSSGLPTTEYDVKMKFTKSSAYYGFQLGASYKITENISVALGGRYVYAAKSMNKIDGKISNILVNPNKPQFNREGRVYDGTNMVNASQFFTDGAFLLNNLYNGATQYSAGLQQIVSGGGGAIPLSQGTLAGLTNEQIGQIQQIIGATGQFTPTQIAGMDIQTAQAVLTSAAPNFKTSADNLSANAKKTQDKVVTVEQTGSGITPIVGLNLNFMDDKLNIGIKYEHQTEIKLKNSTIADSVGFYPDGDEFNADLPGQLNIGLNFRPLNNLSIQVGYHQYFDKNADYNYKEGINHIDNKDAIDKNAWEAAFGLEYALNDKFAISAGYLYTNTSLNEKYQTDMGNSLPSHSFGLGAQFKINDKLDINIGGLYTVYVKKDNKYNNNATPPVWKETYGKDNRVLAFGLGYRFIK